MSKRISPAERLRVEVDEVFAGGEDLAGAIEKVRPKVRGTTERFASQLFGKGVTKTNALESLVIAGFVRGLSTRDVESTLVEALGEAAAVSKSTVSRICDDIRTQFESWSQRRLDDVELDYLFLDGSHFKYHANAAAEPVLAAWGIDTDGKPVFVGLEAAGTESGDAWEGFLRGLGERGLACPLLAQNRIDAFATRWRDSYPAVVRALLADRDSLTVYLRFRDRIGPGRGIRISSSGPLEKRGTGSRRSAGCPASTPVCHWCGQYLTAHRPAGADSP